MIKVGTVYGTAWQARPLVVGKNTVYVHTEINQLEDDLFEYQEEQFEKNEYIEHMSAINADTDDMIVDHELRLTMLELGVDTVMEGGENNAV